MRALILMALLFPVSSHTTTLEESAGILLEKRSATARGCPFSFYRDEELFRRAQFLRHGGNGFPRNPQKAIEVLTFLTQKGHQKAKFELATLLNMEQSSSSEGQRMLEELAKEGYPQALRILNGKPNGQLTNGKPVPEKISWE